MVDYSIDIIKDTSYTIELNEQGPQGIQGERGMQGPQGPVGPKGDKGDKGEKGDTGVSVVGVEEISKVGLVATYRMTFSNGEYFDYEVTDGSIDGLTRETIINIIGYEPASYTSVEGLTTRVETLEGRVEDLTTSRANISLNNLDEVGESRFNSKQDVLISATNIKTINGESVLGSGDIEIKSGGSGLELCDIGMALYIDETKGLRRYLNGQVVDRNTNTEAFFTRLKEITTLHPSLLCTEEEWQTAKTMSAYGQVGKFVFNYSGDNIVSVRIPRVVNVQGLFDLQNLGMTVGAGLPNITSGNLGYVRSGSNIDGSGALKNTSKGRYSEGANVNQSWSGTMNFDASRSNPIYGNSNTVQPEAIQYPYFIQIATGSETENNIINEIELNNPYSLFDSKYSDHELNNLSWLKSEGQWNSKAVYPNAYDELLKEYNNPDRLATFNKYDFTVVGSPTITEDGIASGFSKGNYLKTNIPILNLSGKSFAIYTRINTGNFKQSPTDEIVLYGTTEHNMYSPQLQLYKSGTLIWGGVGIDGGASWGSVQITNISPALLENTYYYFKQVYNAQTNTFTIGFSSDGVVWNEKTVTFNSSSYWVEQIEIGADSNDRFLTGSIDLKKFSITVDGVKVFSGAKSMVKLSTEEYTDYDFVLNTTDETFRLPLLDGSEDLPSDEFLNWTSYVTATESDLPIAPYNGYLAFSGNTIATIGYIYNKTAQLGQGSGQTTGQIFRRDTILLKKGDRTHIYINDVNGVGSLKFIKAKGNGTLYYYVGETVQNANLIDAGRIGEQLATKTDMLQASGAGMPSSKYIDLTLGASGSTYTAPANGWFTLRKIANSDGSANYKFCDMYNTTSSIAVHNNGMYGFQFACSIPALKGDIIQINYNATGNTNLFRFIYAEGSK